MSWYDVSISPNIELFNHVRKTAAPEIANNQYAVIAPVGPLRLQARHRLHGGRRALGR